MRLRFIFPYNAYVVNQANYSNQWVSLGTNVSGRKIALCGDVIVDDGDTGFRDLDILLRKGSNRTTRAMYRVRMIGRDTILYLNQYSSSPSDTGWFYLGEVCTDNFQAPDGSVVIEEKRENPKRGDFGYVES